jgi:hypothetical protein
MSPTIEVLDGLLAKVISVARGIIGDERPTDPHADGDTKMHDAIVSWETHRSHETAQALAYLAFDYFGGVRLVLTGETPDPPEDEDEQADADAREAARAALALLGIEPKTSKKKKRA